MILKSTLVVAAIAGVVAVALLSGDHVLEVRRIEKLGRHREILAFQLALVEEEGRRCSVALEAKIGRTPTVCIGGELLYLFNDEN